MTQDLHVSDHALIRFRTRYMFSAEQHEISDHVAEHWLNAIVRWAQANGLYEDVLDAGRPLRVVELPARYAGDSPIPPCYVLVRDAGKRHATIVTILNAWMRDQNRRIRWRQLDGACFDETPTGRVGALREPLRCVARVR